jgi:hypothetical protein
MQQAAAKTGKAQHKAKAKTARFSLGALRGLATSGNHPQRAANGFLFRLLTGGLLVRIQPEEPIFSQSTILPRMYCAA